MAKKKILLVEDEAVTAMDLKSDLRDLGYEVPAIVVSGEAAIRTAAELHPDLVLMDITLAGPMSGIEAADEITKALAIPIVFLTAHADAETIGKAKATEPAGYLPKPCNLATLVSTIEMALYKSEADGARRKAADELKRLRDEHEEALRKSEEKYRTVADFTYDWEFWIGPDESILYCSPSCERITGHSAAEFAGNPSLQRQLVHPDDLTRYDRHCHGAKTDKQDAELEYRIIRADGLIRWISHVCQPVFDSKGRFAGTRGGNRDITERKGLEAEVAKARNLEALGVLAGGIAHDFNNLLQGLFGNLSLAKMYTSKTNKAFQFLSTAEKLFAHATELTGQLVAFSSGGLAPRVNIQPSGLIREAITSELSGSDLVTEFAVADDLCLVNVDPVQLRQVLKHMVTNAKEAMPSGGRLRVSAANEHLPPTAGKPPALTPGNYVRISIQDQGCGISSENLPRIFDPYFSTKQRGAKKGMGLGLSLCDTIIKKHGGAITVESEPGSGTTFHIHLPAVVTAFDTTVPIKEEGGKGSRLLIMDDDLDVVQVATNFLRLSGFRVDSAPNGDAAITAYQEARAAGDPYAAVILDLTIPGGIGGKEVVAILKKIDPEVKAIVSSGYASDPTITDFANYGFVAACVKPYRLGELKKLLARLI